MELRRSHTFLPPRLFSMVLSDGKKTRMLSSINRLCLSPTGKPDAVPVVGIRAIPAMAS